MPLPPTPGLIGPIASRPLVSVAVLFVAGIAVHDQLPQKPIALLVVTTVTAAAAGFCVGRRYAASLLLAVALVLGGAGLAQREHFAFSADDIGQFATDDARLATVEGTIATEPEVIASVVEHGPPMPPRQTFMADVRRVLTVHGWARATGQLPVRINQPNPSLTAGQTVQLLGMIERPRPATNPGEFDWAVYYRRQRITATLTVNRPANARVLAGPGLSPLEAIRAKARHLLAMGFTAAHVADHAVLQSVLLGDRSPDFRDAAADFHDAGVAYHLNVSGLHVALLAGGLIWACHRLRLRPRRTLVASTAFVVAYAIVASPSYAGWRATVTAAVMAWGLWIRRTSDRLSLIAVAFIVMLAANPLDLYTDGFQLGAISVVALLILLPAIQRGPVDPDRPVRPRRLTGLGETLRQVAIFSTVAWFATVPLVAADFGQLTPWALLGAIAMLPLAAVALYTGAAKVVLTLLWPSIAGPSALVAGWPAMAMRGLASGLVRLPGSHLQLGTPPTWAVVAYYGVLLLQLIPAPRGWWFRTLRFLPVAAVIGLVVASAVPASATAVGLRVTLLSVGAGQCAIIELPGRHVELVDAGSSTVPEVDRRVVAPFLQSHGDHRIDDIFLSHGDYDHISAAGDLASTFSAASVLTSHHFRPLSVGNEPDEALLAKLDELHLRPRELATGDHVDLGGGAAIDVLWPPPDGAWKSNDAGLVLRLTYAGRRILFPADIQDPAFAGVLRHPDLLAADVLVAPHHGSSEPLTPAFLAAVHPSVIVSSNAARLSAKQRRFDEMVGGATPLLRTSKCGAITVTVTPEGRVEVGTYLRPAARR